MGKQLTIKLNEGANSLIEASTFNDHATQYCMTNKNESIHKITISLSEFEKTDYTDSFNDFKELSRQISASSHNNLTVEFKGKITQLNVFKSLLKCFVANQNIQTLILNVPPGANDLQTLLAQTKSAIIHTINLSSDKFRLGLREGRELKYLTKDSLKSIVTPKTTNLLLPAGAVLFKKLPGNLSSFGKLLTLNRKGNPIEITDNLVTQLREANLHELANAMTNVIEKLEGYRANSGNATNIADVYDAIDEAHTAITAINTQETLAIENELSREQLLTILKIAVGILFIAAYVAVMIYLSIDLKNYTPHPHRHFVKGGSCGGTPQYDCHRTQAHYEYNDPTQELKIAILGIVAIVGGVISIVTIITIAMLIFTSPLVRAIGQRAWQLLRSLAKLENDLNAELLSPDSDNICAKLDSEQGAGVGCNTRCDNEGIFEQDFDAVYDRPFQPASIVYSS